MNLSLTEVKVHDDMSEETICFSARLMRDGRCVAQVKNTGRGGSNVYYWSDRNEATEIENWANAQPTEFQFEKLDQIVMDLLLQHVERQERIARGRN